MAEPIKAWECIGCGRIEAPQTCIGICQDQPVWLVSAAEHEEALARIEALERFVRQLAATSPREGQWEASYRALQRRARELVSARPASESRSA